LSTGKYSFFTHSPKFLQTDQFLFLRTLLAVLLAPSFYIIMTMRKIELQISSIFTFRSLRLSTRTAYIFCLSRFKSAPHGMWNQCADFHNKAGTVHILKIMASNSFRRAKFSHWTGTEMHFFANRSF
jgi:hypothetical protein